uniref:hydroxyacid oxidase 1-like isoform X2 n=1 Tax=Styela clava TaxID=7725 RepID=UPI0019394DE0|nr:hydroxyacid oxidase 1-like isoform X2 [Styela clava]
MESNLICIEDYERIAKKRISPYYWGFYSGGAVGEHTIKENCDAYKRWRFRPKLLRNVSKVDCSTTVLNSRIPFPICVGPTANHAFAYQEGEVATAKAAASLGTGMTLSLFSNRSMEEVAMEAPDGIRWCHIQVIPDRAVMGDFITRAEENGFRGFIVTIDQPVFGKRCNKTDDGETYDFIFDLEQKNISTSIKKWKPNAQMEDIVATCYSYLDGTETWENIDWLKQRTNLPIVVKGILTEEMALEAIEHKVDGILVSNHGGRQLDGTFATIDSLPEVVKAVNGRCDVYFDGGIRKGTDIAKALALGAKAVFIGRPILWGLACDGEAGVKKVLEILKDELVTTMQLLGVTSIKELQSTPNLVVHESRVFAKL